MGNIKNILLTGATGYLGSNLAKKFVSEGYNVFILKRTQSSLSRIESILPSIKIFDIDEINYDDLFSSVPIDIILHVATAYGRKGESLTDIYNANVAFPLALLEYALKYNVKFFFNTNTTLPPDLNVYALSKNQFNQILKMHSGRINIVDIELQYFYGPGDDASKFVSFIISKLNTNVDHIDLSPGTQIRDFIYIDDVVNAYLVLLNNTSILSSYQTVPLGTGIGITLKNITEKIKKILNNTHTTLNFGALPFRDGEVMHSVADINLLTKLNWKPCFKIDEGLNETLKLEKSLFV